MWRRAIILVLMSGSPIVALACDKTPVIPKTGPPPIDVWSSSDTTLATVSQTGLVNSTGATGVATITAAAAADPKVTGKSMDTVSATVPPRALVRER
jgi:hypothetical protein